LDLVGVVELLAVPAGFALVLVTAADAVSTLVTTRRRRGRRWPTPVFYRATWRAWGAVWWGLRSAVPGVDGYLEAVCFAGVGFVTVGFGDLVPTGGMARLLVLVEAFMGLVTMFRSRQPGQHWLTALGVVTDAATITLSTIHGSGAGPAARLWRRATRMLQNFRALPAIGTWAAELLLVPMEFRHHTSRLGITRPT
jgi:Ion channel